jgi:murein DD-endopeptidase MepM/ murein hydrolase activator NlpD
VLGKVGKSGNAGAAHLHLEMRVGPAGHVFGSLAAYDPSAVETEKEAYKLWRTSGVFQHFDPMFLFELVDTSE